MTKTAKTSPTFMCATALLEELKLAQGQLAPKAQKSAHATAKEQAENSLHLVARLVTDMDKAAWENFCSTAPTAGWCALEVCMQSGETTLQGDTLAPMAHSILGTQHEHAKDPLTQILLATPFVAQLEQEVQRAKRGDAPLSVVYFAFAAKDGHELMEDAPIIYKAVQEYGNICDTLGNVGQHHLGLILPGAKSFTAQNLVEDMLHLCTSKGLALRAGIASSKGNDCETSLLLEQAALALQEAILEKKEVCSYRPPAQDMETRRTLVQSHEKRFLFGGE